MNTIWKKTKLALAQTSGVMRWELSNEVKGERSLLRVINTTVDPLSASVSINLPKAKGLAIYLNPANDHLKLENTPSGQLATISIIDMNGKMVK